MAAPVRMDRSAWADASILENAPPEGSTLSEEDRYNIEKAGADGQVILDKPAPEFEYQPGSKPSPWTDLEQTPEYQAASTESKLKAYNNYVRRLDLWAKTQPNYTPKDRAIATEAIRARRAKIEAGETTAEKAAEFGEAFVDSAIGSLSSLPVAVASQFTEDSRESFYAMAGASATKALDYVTREHIRREVPSIDEERFEALKAEGFTPKTDSQRRIGEFIDRREKLDAAVVGFKDALDNGEFPANPEEFRAWLDAKQSDILKEAQRYNEDDEDYAANPTRKFSTDIDLVNLLADYTATRDDASFGRMTQQMVRSSDREKADATIEKTLSEGGGMIGALREADKANTGGDETARLVSQAATDPTELASTVISAILSGGTAKALASTTKAGMAAKTVANTAIDVAVEAGTEAFQAKVEDPNAPIGEAAATGALLALAFQLTGAAAGIANRRAIGGDEITPPQEVPPAAGPAEAPQGSSTIAPAVTSASPATVPPTIFTIDDQRAFMPDPEGRGWLEVFPTTGDVPRLVDLPAEGETGTAILGRLEAKIAQKRADVSPPVEASDLPPAGEGATVEDDGTRADQRGDEGGNESGPREGSGGRVQIRPGDWHRVREGGDPRRDSGKAAQVFRDALSGLPPEVDGTAAREWAEVAAPAEIAAVAAGRKPIFHEHLGDGMADATDAMAMRLAEAFPNLRIEAFDGHLVAVDLETAGAIAGTTDPEATMEAVREAVQSDNVGEFLGYGSAHWSDEGSRSVEIRRLDGTLVAGFRAPAENAEEFARDRFEDYRNATDEPLLLSVELPQAPAQKTGSSVEGDPVESSPPPPSGDQNFGPGAANVDEPLAEIPEGYAESGSYQTIKDAIARGDFAPGIEDFLPSLYEKETRREWVDQAIEEVTKEGEAAATANVMRVFQEGSHKPKDVAKLSFLSKNYEIQRKAAEASGNRTEEVRLANLQQDLLGSYMEAQTDIARILNAGYLIRHLTPEGQIRAIIKATNQIGKKKKRNNHGEDAEIADAADAAIKRTRKKTGSKKATEPDGTKERTAAAEAEGSAESAENAADEAAQSLADWVAEFFSDTPNLTAEKKAQATDLAKFLATSRRHANGRDAWTKDAFEAEAKRIGVGDTAASNLWNAISAGNQQSKASKTALADLAEQKREAARVDRAIEEILAIISDTPDLRDGVKAAESAMSKFLRDAKSHANGSTKFRSKTAFDAAAKGAGVSQAKAESLWNAITKSHSDAKTHEAIKADLAEQKRARRDAFIGHLERQWGRSRLNRVLKKKGRMIDALLDGQRPEQAVEDFYSAVDLPPAARTRILDILDRAEKAQGAMQASLLDEARKIISDSMPPQYFDALHDAFGGSIFSGLGTQMISVVGTLENAIVNLAGHITTDILKARREGVKFGRTSAALKGTFSPETFRRAKAAFNAVLYDMPIDDNVSRFGAGNRLATLMDRDDVPIVLLPWLAQHWVYRVMGMVDQTLKSFVFRSEAGVLAYEDAVESGLSPDDAVKAVTDQSAKFAKAQWDADVATAREEYRRAFGAEPDTAKERSLVELRAMEIMERRMKPEIRDAASSRGSDFNLMGDQPDDFLGQVARGFMKMVNVGWATDYGDIRPIRFLVPVVNVLFNSFRSAIEHTPLGLFAGGNKAYTHERQKLAFTRARGALAISLSAIVLQMLSDALGDEDDEGPFRFRIHGKGPDDNELRKALMSAGWKPFSIEVRLPGQDRSVFKRYGEGPLALSFSLIGGAFDALRYGDTTPEKFSDYAGILAQSAADSFALLGELGPAKTIANFATLTSFEESYGENGLENFIQAIGNTATGMVVPFSSLFRDISNMVDPRITNKGEMTGPMREVIPFTKGAGEVVLDQFGDEVTRPRLRAVDRFASVESDDELLATLNEKGVALNSLSRTGTGGLSIRVANSTASLDRVYEIYVKEGGDPERMTREQYVDHFKAHRQKLRAFLEERLPQIKEMESEKVEEFVQDAKTIFSNVEKLKLMGANERIVNYYESSKLRELRLPTPK